MKEMGYIYEISATQEQVYTQNRETRLACVTIFKSDKFHLHASFQVQSYI